MLDSNLLRKAISGTDDEHERAVDQVRDHYQWSLEQALKPKVAKTYALATFRDVERLRCQLAALGEFHPPLMGRA
ncbi:hypothetical protein D0Z70_22535 [Sphingobium terrigena]|uniref:Uncharacterized protein n=1 Tax=Sphingobium terrigena TaxID=2304063 RepID=A0A418YLX5_9SPHN|nr:hypothetical protein [Sphingobium terrigena]RJG51809.1 hypothetical protein D0Z70_22535 [Sphingobium terrigena]